MNHDDFETKLRALVGSTRQPDPTPAWKADILARARRAASAAPAVRMRPPRALLVAWAAAWAAIALISLATPPSTVHSPTAQVIEPASLLTNSPVTLIAFERRYQSDPDLP